ncbi:MAG: TetR/AcrR family transcriptional regulator [Pseudomonadales bacterium]|nr:TetR/AcrR family transcriptional regulator [Pseudomonadales bacterium]
MSSDEKDEKSHKNQSEGTTAKEPRGARRKRATRQKLINAGLALMSERGKNGVSINEITEAADVGFGSFYNHFESKDAIYDALIEEVLNSIGDAIEVATNKLEDPAAILATAIRNVMNHAQRNPVWGRFLLRTAYSSEVLTLGMGKYMMNDLLRGMDANRFNVNDPVMAFLTVGGTVLSALALSIELNESTTNPTKNNAVQVANGLGYSLENLDQRTASSVLQILGLSVEEADTIANAPLPDIKDQ